MGGGGGERSLSIEPPALAELDLEPDGLDKVLPLCSDARVRREIETAPSDAARVASCEDALHHQPWIWRDCARAVRLRSEGPAPQVSITLPFPATWCRTAIPIDEP